MTDTHTDVPGDGADPFAGLESQATALEGAAEADRSEREQSQAAETIASTAGELAEALKLVRSLGAPMMAWWEKYEATWSDAAIDAIAQAGAAVMQKHGWTMGQAWAHLGPYIALLAATAPPALVTWQAVKQRQAQLAYEARQQQGRPHIAPVAETVQAAP
jgi:hypothetical protein